MPDFHLSIECVKTAFPRFVSIEELPGGGQKLVYRVTCSDGQTYALKIVKQDHGPQDERTIRELSAAAKLKASCFAKISEAQYCQVNGVKCISILEEYIHGQSLASILEKGALSLSFVRNVGFALLTALVHLEEADLVHRDIKPANIMIDKDGRVVLIDFGIARHLDKRSVTSSYAFFGPMTVGYCAPEQIQNAKRQISIRTDLFAVGIVLYEMATGKNPFCDGSRSTQEVIERCICFHPPRLSILGYPAGLSDFVETCMAKASHRRPASAHLAIELFATIKWED
jgi:serine/threonine protein kinase